MLDPAQVVEQSNIENGVASSWPCLISRVHLNYMLGYSRNFVHRGDTKVSMLCRM
jgi:hypothetical protein